MREGDVVVTPLPQADGRTKHRPAVVLRAMPPLGDFLLCGISTQLHRESPGFDEVINASDGDFITSGVKSPSLVRLGFLGVLSETAVSGAIGWISEERHRRLLQRLSNHLAAPGRPRKPDRSESPVGCDSGPRPPPP